MKAFVLSIFLFATYTVFGQVAPKSILVDEFGSIACDEMLAKIDNFSNQLRNDPTARGLVTISGSNANLIKKLDLEVLFTSGVIQRRVHTSQIRLERGRETGEPKMSFWLVPRGADEPEVSVSSWDMAISPKNKPFYFFADSDSICSYPTVDKYIKQLLSANPGLRVNVVIHAGSPKKTQELKRDTVKLYGPKYSKRLRFFRVRETYPESQREYWLLP